MRNAVEEGEEDEEEEPTLPEKGASETLAV